MSPSASQLADIGKAKRNLALFAAVGCVWLVCDQVTKVLVNANGVEGLRSGGIAGLFNVVLVHNTGAAWGILDDSTLLLGCFALVICLLVLFWTARRKASASSLEIVALALVFAGGLGNAIDRFARGYVVDFINLDFVDFPVFNIADIGVTCGFILLVIVLILEPKISGSAEKGK